MTGTLRIPSLHLVLDMKTVGMVSCFKNGERWMLYIWFQGAQDVLKIEIIEKAIFEEIAEAIDTLDDIRTLDTKWKNDLMIEIMAFLKTVVLIPSMVDTVKSVAMQCLLSHKTKVDILNDLKKQLGHVNLTPGVSASLLAKIV